MGMFLLLACAIAFKLFCSWHVCGEATCRILEFLEPETGMRLKDHVIQSTSVDEGKQCQLQCYLELSCLSYNLGTEENGTKLLCELSDSDRYQHPGDLVRRKGFSYHGTASFCGGVSCPPAPSCLPNQQGTLRCVCSAHWQEMGNCQRDVDECTTGSHSCHVNATCTDIVGNFTCECKNDSIGDGVQCKYIGSIFHWALDGTDSSVRLHGASYKNVDGRKVLHLNGSHSYAETTAVPIQTISFSILCWVQVLSSPGTRNIYSDWSKPFQFRLYIYNQRFCTDLRKKVYRKEDYDNIVSFCGGKITIGQWTHVAFTWSRENRTGKLFSNGTRKDMQEVTDPTKTIDLNPTNHSVYDIGLKRDSGKKDTLHGYLRELIVVERAISDEDVRDVFTWSKN